MLETQECALFVRQKLIPMTLLRTVIKASAITVPEDIKLKRTISARKAVVVMDNATFSQYIVLLIGYNLTAISQ
ncbi:MAG: hypothetical protein M3146_05290 [Thermoproteota archaeon]|nr:hypothetical protein [Thermoproteota archaeon]